MFNMCKAGVVLRVDLVNRDFTNRLLLTEGPLNNIQLLAKPQFE